MLGECLLISSLPGKAFRTLVELSNSTSVLKVEPSKPSDSTNFLKAEPGILDIKRHKPFTCIL